MAGTRFAGGLRLHHTDYNEKAAGILTGKDSAVLFPGLGDGRLRVHRRYGINENAGEVLTGPLRGRWIGESGRVSVVLRTGLEISGQTFHIWNGKAATVSTSNGPSTRATILVDIDIAQLKTGDRPAWERAFEILYTIGLSVCCASAPDLNHHDREDVAVESVTQVVDYVEQAGSFEECKRLVVTIVKNRLLDRFRQRSTQKHGAGRVESLEQQEGFDAPDPGQQTPDVHVSNGELASMLATGLRQIPEQYRKVVEDFYLKRLTQQEIAERQGFKLGSIGVYLDRGLKALAKVVPKDALLL